MAHVAYVCVYTDWLGMAELLAVPSTAVWKKKKLGVQRGRKRRNNRTVCGDSIYTPCRLCLFDQHVSFLVPPFQPPTHLPPRTHCKSTALAMIDPGGRSSTASSAKVGERERPTIPSFSLDFRLPRNRPCVFHVSLPYYTIAPSTRFDPATRSWRFRLFSAVVGIVDQQTQLYVCRYSSSNWIVLFHYLNANSIARLEDLSTVDRCCQAVNACRLYLTVNRHFWGPKPKSFFGENKSAPWTLSTFSPYCVYVLVDRCAAQYGGILSFSYLILSVPVWFLFPF